MSPTRKVHISNQDSDIIINIKYPILPPLLSKCHTKYKPLFNGTHYPNKTEDDLF